MAALYVTIPRTHSDSDRLRQFVRDEEGLRQPVRVHGPRLGYREVAGPTAQARGVGCPGREAELRPSSRSTPPPPQLRVVRRAGALYSRRCARVRGRRSRKPSPTGRTGTGRARPSGCRQPSYWASAAPTHGCVKKRRMTGPHVVCMWTSQLRELVWCAYQDNAVEFRFAALASLDFGCGGKSFTQR